MDEQIKQIAERLRGLRDAMELTTEELANECGIDRKYDAADCPPLRYRSRCADVR